MEELVKAQYQVFKLTQKEYLSGIEDGQISSLCPFEDNDGLVRIKTKLIERPDGKNFNLHILLPGNHSVVHRFIKYKHEENSHVGVQDLLREDSWIISGSRTVKSIVDKFIICKRYCVQSLDTVPVPLPSHRVRGGCTVEVCGVD